KVVPSPVMDVAMQQDQGLIYVFNTETRAVRLLRGHQGVVTALTFAPPRPGAGKGEAPPLFSAALESVAETQAHTGAVWLWDVEKRTHQDWPGKLPDLGTIKRATLTAWRSPARPEDLFAAIAWGDGVFRLWDVAGGKAGALVKKGDAQFNTVVASLLDQGLVV